ncbi:MAG: SMC-Scp complex subunit ScpB [Bdellovibrionales bacterium]|nr:SMC-Scp complex subunit ScpB [Bdellovibrionales bacterium]
MSAEEQIEVVREEDDAVSSELESLVTHERQHARDFEKVDQRRLLEALIFVHGEPLSIELMVEVTGIAQEEISELLEELAAQHKERGSGFLLEKVAGKYQFRSVPEFSVFMQHLKTGGPRRLSIAALETLAIIAYRQPVVKSDIEKLRGVDATPTLRTLLDRNLIRIVGHQASVGQPALYGTTEEFLKIFGMNSLDELPSQRDLAELEDPGEPQMLQDQDEATPVAPMQE